MIDSNGAILTKISNISKSIPVQKQKAATFFLQSPMTTDYTKSKKGLTSLKSQVFLLVVDYSVFNELQVHVIVSFAVIC